MSNNEKNRQTSVQTEELSLNDDRRVRTLSPGALVIRRFLRNRVAVTGLVILILMALFSFVGGLLTPYKEDQLFYSTTEQRKQYAAVKENTEYRYVTASKDSFPSVAQAKFVLARKTGKDTFEAKKVTYTCEDEGNDVYIIYKEGEETPVAFATYDIVSSSTGDEEVPFLLQCEIVKASAEGKDSFTYE